MPLTATATPICAICCDRLGKYGGPCSLPCGHNACLHCISQAHRVKPECPLCRKSIPPGQELVVNPDLRELISLAAALGTVEQDGWQTVTSNKLSGGPDAIERLQQGADVKLLPSAPPMQVSLSTVLDGHDDLMSLEPPTWLPDSCATACEHCTAPFQTLRRSRHHCRLCGHIFCHACSSSFLLLPPRFQQPCPQRTCISCSTLLEPVQPFLAGTISRAVQPAVHDVTDGSVVRAWLNVPLSSCLDQDIFKATNIVKCFAAVGTLGPERGLPSSVLAGAAGFAIMSTAKAGMGWSATVGSGLVVARKSDGSWSAPSALLMYGLGWGLQFGGSISDLLIVLRTPAAVQAFCGTVQAGVGGGVSLAVGPLGRQADAALRVARSGAAVIYSYCITRGMFAGVSVDGTVMRARDSINRDFYGRPLTAKQLLTGDSPAQPLAARPLYAALDDMLACYGIPRGHVAAASTVRQAQAGPAADADLLSISDAAIEAPRTPRSGMYPDLSFHRSAMFDEPGLTPPPPARHDMSASLPFAGELDGGSDEDEGGLGGLFAE